MPEDNSLLGEFPLEIKSEDGEVYNVQPLEATNAVLQDLWEKFIQFDVVFSDDRRDNKSSFFNTMMDINTVVLTVDDVGVFYATMVEPGVSALVHFLFWDRKTAKRHRLIMSVIKYFMDEFELNRIAMAVPRYAYAALRRLHKIGVLLEGVQRNAIKKDGKWGDILLFGIQADELTDNSIEDKYLPRTYEESKWYGLLDNDTKLMKYVVRHGHTSTNAVATS